MFNEENYIENKTADSPFNLFYYTLLSLSITSAATETAAKFASNSSVAILRYLVIQL